MFTFAPAIRTLFVSAALVVVAFSQVGCETTTMIREKGYRAMRAGDLPLAEHHFARAVQREPEDYLSQYYLGVVYLRQGEPLKAQLALEKALTLRPDGSPRTGDILDHLAEAMYQRGRYDSLHAFLAKSASYYGRTEDYLRQARYLVKTGDIDQAKIAYQKAAYFAEKGDATPYLAVAEFYESINNAPEAVAALKYAYYVDPENEKVAAGLRKHGIVPGPTVAAEPPKPEMLR